MFNKKLPGLFLDDEYFLKLITYVSITLGTIFIK